MYPIPDIKLIRTDTDLTVHKAGTINPFKEKALGPVGLGTFS